MDFHCQYRKVGRLNPPRRRSNLKPFYNSIIEVIRQEFFWMEGCPSTSLIHGVQKITVVFSTRQFVQQEFHSIDCV